MAENFPNLMRDVSINIQEAQQIESKMNSKRPTSTHTVFKLSKGKGKRKQTREAKKRWIHHVQRIFNKYISRFREDLEARKQWAQSIQYAERKTVK